jgi:hypothetical protein
MQYQQTSVLTNWNFKFGKNLKEKFSLKDISAFFALIAIDPLTSPFMTNQYSFMSQNYSFVNLIKFTRKKCLQHYFTECTVLHS